MNLVYVAVTFKSVLQILWCDHSNETSSAHFHMKLRIYSAVLSLWTKSYGMTSQIKTSSAEI